MSNMSLDIRDLQLNALLEITQAVNNNLPEEDLLRIYKFTLLADLKISRLALFTEQNGKWMCRVNFGTPENLHETELPEKYFGINKEHYDVDFASGFDLALPVLHKDKCLAIMFISAKEQLGEQYRFLKALTNIILVAIENKRLARQQIEQEAYKRELEIAKKVQNFLFPKELPDEGRIRLEALYLPHHDVGGDYYDYLKITENRILLCIADVSGKGVPAALLMSNFQASLRALVRQDRDLKDIINELNYSTFVSGNAENFITFFAAIYDFEKQELEYVNCGHNDIVLRVGKEIHLLSDGTTVLGMLNPLPFLETKTISNLNDFFLFAYTDGLTETFNEEDEAFEFDRLLDMLKDHSGDSLGKLLNQIVDKLKDFKGARPFHDDITMLSCRIKSEG